MDYDYSLQRDRERERDRRGRGWGEEEEEEEERGREEGGTERESIYYIKQKTSTLNLQLEVSLPIQSVLILTL